MHPVMKSLLRMIGIDPDHPEQMMDALASALEINPTEFKEMPNRLISACQNIDERLSALQAAVERLDARQQLQQELLKHERSANPEPVDLERSAARVGNAIDRATRP